MQPFFLQEVEVKLRIPIEIKMINCVVFIKLDLVLIDLKIHLYILFIAYYERLFFCENRQNNSLREIGTIKSINIVRRIGLNEFENSGKIIIASSLPNV